MALFQKSNKVVDPQLAPKNVFWQKESVRFLVLVSAAMRQSGYLISPKRPWVLPLGQMGQVIKEVAT